MQQPGSGMDADERANIQLADFSIAEFAAELAEEHADRRSLLKGKQPTGGFHKRHLVRPVAAAEISLTWHTRGCIQHSGQFAPC